MEEVREGVPCKCPSRCGRAIDHSERCTGEPLMTKLLPPFPNRGNEGTILEGNIDEFLNTKQ